MTGLHVHLFNFEKSCGQLKMESAFQKGSRGCFTLRVQGSKASRSVHRQVGDSQKTTRTEREIRASSQLWGRRGVTRDREVL